MKLHWRRWRTRLEEIGFWVIVVYCFLSAGGVGFAAAWEFRSLVDRYEDLDEEFRDLDEEFRRAEKMMWSYQLELGDSLRTFERLLSDMQDENPDLPKLSIRLIEMLPHEVLHCGRPLREPNPCHL